MKQSIIIGICMIFLVCGSAMAGDHTFGLGFHYFYTIDEIDDDLSNSLGDAFHEDGLAINFSYRYKWNSHFGVLAEVQTYPDGYLDAETSLSPRLLLVIGQGFFIGAGIGWNNVDWEDATEHVHDSDEWTDAFYMIRAGVEFPLLTEYLFLEINANYEFNEWNDVDQFDSDIITFGAAIKFTL